MAIFEDVNGKAQVINTDPSRIDSVSDVHDIHRLDGSNERHTHTVTALPNGHSLTSDTTDRTETVNGTVFHTTEVLSDDGMGHRRESLTRSFDQHVDGALVRQAESVTKQLGAHEGKVDLTHALDDRGTLGVEHELSLASTTKSADGGYHTDTAIRHFDTVGNESRRHVESESYTSVRDGIASVDTVSRDVGDHSSSTTEIHKDVSIGNDGRRYESRQVDQVSEGYTQESHTTDSHAAGKPMAQHVSHSLHNHLVEHGFSHADAAHTLEGVSGTLGHAIEQHAMGSGATVEFHKEGPVAVSISHGGAQSNSNTVAVPMDALKSVHESGMAQDLSSVSGTHQPMQTAAVAHEMSR